MLSSAQLMETDHNRGITVMAAIDDSIFHISHWKFCFFFPLHSTIYFVLVYHIKIKQNMSKFALSSVKNLILERLYSPSPVSPLIVNELSIIKIVYKFPHWLVFVSRCWGFLRIARCSRYNLTQMIINYLCVSQPVYYSWLWSSHRLTSNVWCW